MSVSPIIMETPPNSKFRGTRPNLGIDIETVHNPAMETEDSPNYFPSTQDSVEGIDVGWNWNSPQGPNQKIRKRPKRLLNPVPSPIIPLRRYPSKDQTSNIEELYDDLKALQQALAPPDDESCRCVSPQKEHEFKSIIVDDKDDQMFPEFDDIFNDSVNEQLVVFSQKIEDTLISDQCEKRKTDMCNSTIFLDGLVNKYSTTSTGASDNFFSDDNDDWDQILGTIEEEKIVTEFSNSKLIDNNNIPKSALPSKNKFTFKKTTALNRTKSLNDDDSRNDFIKILSGKVELHRTKSFENEVVQEKSLSQNVLEEIEKKRLEALAKLEAKRKKTSTLISPVVSPSKCSQQEIEIKRQQALAKLEAKRIQENVERNRLEALKRLQSSRQKKATSVRSTLFKRL